MKAALTLTIFTVLSFACGQIETAGQTTIRLNPNTTFQTIDSWEAVATIGESENPREFLTWQNSVLDQAAELGINRLRLEIKSGIENPTDYFQQFLNGQITISQFNQHRYEIINDNADPNSVNPSGFQFTQIDFIIDNVVLPLKQRLAAAGERLYVNVNYVDFGNSTFEHKTSPAEYAEFVYATYQHLQTRYGWVPDSWEVILEPDTSTAAWSASQVANCLAAAGARLAAAGYTPAFVAPSVTNAANAANYFDMIAATSGALGYLKEVSYHRYGGASEGTLQAIASRAVANKMNTAMLEWIGADYQALHQDLTIGRNSSWQQFTLAYPTSDNGAQYFTIDRSAPSSPVVNIGSRTKFLRQYFKFIRRGALRIEATSDASEIEPLAFINPGGRYTVIVKARAAGTFSVQNLPAGTYGIKYSTDSQYNIDVSDITLISGQALNASIPGSGVMTIYAMQTQPQVNDKAVIEQCTVEQDSSGVFVLTILGKNFKDGATATVGGISPKKIKFKKQEDSIPGTFKKLILKGRFCEGLPGVIIITNPGSPASAPFDCRMACQ